MIVAGRSWLLMPVRGHLGGTGSWRWVRSCSRCASARSPAGVLPLVFGVLAQHPPYRRGVDTEPGRDLSGGPVGMPPPQPGDLTPGPVERLLASPWMYGVLVFVVMLTVNRLTRRVTERSDLAGLLIAAGTGLCLGVLQRVVAWVLRERRLRRAADYALRECQRRVGGSGEGA
jgi:hypothetical protein